MGEQAERRPARAVARGAVLEPPDSANVRMLRSCRGASTWREAGLLAGSLAGYRD